MFRDFLLFQFMLAEIVVGNLQEVMNENDICDFIQENPKLRLRTNDFDVDPL